jgi:oligopeptide/dipeptide ABC transporter ATP-binding protein
MAACIEVRNLKKYFKVSQGWLHAVDDVTLSVEKGKTVGVVGESGCGKSTLGRTIIHLQHSTGGSIFFNGEEVTEAKGRELHRLRADMQIIFQDPYSSLNPRRSVEEIIRQPLKLSGRFHRALLNQEVTRLMDVVGIDQRLRNAYPHELDGGRRQRVGIARAIALNPAFVVCDEPVSSLDVSIQAQILNLLMDLQDEFGLTYMFVTHDLSVVRHISDTICVMYLGQLVETSPSKELFSRPLHPYTKALLSSIPSIDIDRPMKRVELTGEITSPINPKPGCRFAARCPYVQEKCHEPQVLEEIEPQHFVLCCRVREIHAPGMRPARWREAGVKGLPEPGASEATR